MTSFNRKEPHRHAESGHRKISGLRATLGGLALLALSAVFNDAAHAEDVAPPATPTVTTPVDDRTAQQKAQAEADDALIAQLRVIADHLQKNGKSDPLYDAAADKTAGQYIDRLAEILRAGANGNLTAPDRTIDLLGYQNTTPFAAAILIAVETGRLDLLDSFTAAGARAAQIATDQWRPMDYAISAFLDKARSSRAKTAHAFAVIRHLEDQGAQMADAVEVGRLHTPPNAPVITRFDSYATLAVTVMALQVIEETGAVVTYDEGGRQVPLRAADLLHGRRDAAQDLLTEKRLRRGFVENNGGLLRQNEFTAFVPGGHTAYRVQPGDTLAGIAQRFLTVMDETSPLRALSTLTRINNLDAQAALPPWQTILIPTPQQALINPVGFKDDARLHEIARYMADRAMFYKPDASVADIVRELAVVNNIPPDEALDPDYILPAGTPLVVLFRNDMFAHMEPLVPPADIDPTRRVDLAIIESRDPEDRHHRLTYGSATGTAFAINRAFDPGRIFAWNEHFLDYPQSPQSIIHKQEPKSDALLHFMTNPQNPLRDRLVFSQSMEISIGDARDRGGPPKPVALMNAWQAGGCQLCTALHEMQQALRIIEKSAPIFFSAAGNQYANGEGTFKQSNAITHGPRTYTVGSAGRYKVFTAGGVKPGYVISAYSTGGADICAPLPSYQFAQQEGTSFSTPLMAALFRQMNEWYGHRLDTEEIMAAALMTADRDVLDYDNPLIVNRQDTPQQYKAHSAKFVTNGAGLPYHPRCGAGVVNVERWNETLKRLVEIKRQPEINAAIHSHTIALGEPAYEQSDRHGGRYVYTITVPAAMTLGKTTLLAPQFPGQYGDIALRMPSGFTAQLPRSVMAAISSHAFAYEDLKAGDTIQIISHKKLAPQAEITLRGFGENNAVAQLRDELRAQEILPAPLGRLGGAPATLPLPQAPSVSPEDYHLPAISGGDDKAEPPAMPGGNTPDPDAPDATPAPLIPPPTLPDSGDDNKKGAPPPAAPPPAPDPRPF